MFWKKLVRILVKFTLVRTKTIGARRLGQQQWNGAGRHAYRACTSPSAHSFLVVFLRIQVGELKRLVDGVPIGDSLFDHAYTHQ